MQITGHPYNSDLVEELGLPHGPVTVRACFAALRTHRYILSTFSFFPDEILQRVLICVASNVTMQSRWNDINTRDLRSLCAVSRRWRVAAISHCPLWTNIPTFSIVSIEQAELGSSRNADTIAHRTNMMRLWLDRSEPRQDTTDYDSRVLTFALSLEQLVNSFYNTSLDQLSYNDFRAAGYPDAVRMGYERISASTQGHVDWLVQEISGLGNAFATGSCTYGFPVNTVQDFVDLSEAFQALAVSTYTGAAHRVQTERYSTAFASMLGVEARFSNWISTSVKQQDLWGAAFENPGSFNTTWTIAGQYVTGCPAGVDPEDILPHNLVNFPKIETLPTDIIPGDLVNFTFDETSVTDGSDLYAAFEAGLGYTIVPVRRASDDDGYIVQIPEGLGGMGAVWMYILTSGGDVPEVATDDNIAAGPALIMFPTGHGRQDQTRNAWAW